MGLACEEPAQPGQLVQEVTGTQARVSITRSQALVQRVRQELEQASCIQPLDSAPHTQ